MATPVLVRTEKRRARLNPKSHQSLLVCCSSSGSSAALAPQPSSQSAIYVREAAQPSNRLDPLTRVARGDVPVHQERSSRHHRPVHHKGFASEVARSIHGRKIAFTCRMARTTWTVKGGGDFNGKPGPIQFRTVLYGVSRAGTANSANICRLAPRGERAFPRIARYERFLLESPWFRPLNICLLLLSAPGTRAISDGQLA